MVDQVASLRAEEQRCYNRSQRRYNWQEVVGCREGFDSLLNMDELPALDKLYDWYILLNTTTLISLSLPAAVLRGIPYKNNSNVTLEDIGEGPNALLCITNQTAANILMEKGSS